MNILNNITKEPGKLHYKNRFIGKVKELALKSSVEKSKRKVFYNTKQSIAACLIGTMIAGGVLYYYNYKQIGYEVLYDGKLTGCTYSKKVASETFEFTKQKIKNLDHFIVVNDNISFRRKKIDTATLTSHDDFEQMLKSCLNVRTSYCSLIVNGSEIAVVDNESAAQQVLEGVKKYFIERKARDDVEIVDIVIKDDIEIVKKNKYISHVMDVNTAIGILSEGKEEAIRYEIKPGDSLWTISRDNTVKVEDILALNPGLNSEKLKSGQIIYFLRSIPNLNIEITYNMTTNELLPYETKYITDNTMYKNQTKVISNGKPGLSKIITSITELNGKEILRSILSSVIIINPVAKVIAKGTNDIIGTGKFFWPVHGQVSSPFGNRGEGYHKGLDIRAPLSSAIYAADSGIVTYAGWYNSYGNLVIINHKNGFETYYGHCNTISTKEGQTISRGQLIATVGHTGNADGNHVHFEVRLNGNPQNPLAYIK